jgi:hypothetical protein
MTVIEIHISDERPAVAMVERKVLTDPVVAFSYSGFRLCLSESAMLKLKQAFKDGEGKFEYYRRRMEAANNLPLPFVEM